MKAKKILLLLFASMLLCSCSCLLSQIPPQYIYAGSGCTAPLPDYRTYVTVTGGCTGFTVTQTPAPGTLLTVTTKTATVIIKATGLARASQVSFVVSMLDTITPKITPIGPLADYQLKQSEERYAAGDKITGELFNLLLPANDDYHTKLLVNVSVDSAGYRKRFITYLDSLTFPIWTQDTSKIASYKAPKIDYSQTDYLIAYLKGLLKNGN